MAKRRRLVLCVISITTASLCTLTRGDELDDQYAAKLKALAPNDLQGHLSLAVWCRDKQRWDLLAKQCHRVKQVDPKNEKADLLLELARTHLEKNQRSDPTGEATTGVEGAPPRECTEAEIQAVRRAELCEMSKENCVETAKVRVDQAVAKSFYEKLPPRSLPYDRATFFRLTPLEKAQVMLKYGDPDTVAKIEIATDPIRMKTFDREVMPLVLANCATVECHGGAGKFRLLGGRSLKPNAVYANYLLLHEKQVGNEWVINRSTPERSLLLTYGMPPGPTPELNHPVPIEPPFAGVAGARETAKISTWLKMLALERPKYSVSPTPPPAP